MKKVLSIVLAISMLLTIAFTAFAAPAPKPGNPSWEETLINKYMEARNAPLVGVYNPRGNASGEKIPSNAHSGDFDGIYFFWTDDKGAASQKDPGVLLVNAYVFDYFSDGKFILTAKNSANYYDYEVRKDLGKVVSFAEDGVTPAVYAFGIPRDGYAYLKNGKITYEDFKNINMVFVDGLWRTATYTIKKVWLDSNEDPIDDFATFFEELGFEEPVTPPVATFNRGKASGSSFTFRLYALDTIDITITEDNLDWSITNLIPGDGEYTYWFKLFAIDGDTTIQNKTITLRAGDDITVKFENKIDYTVTPKSWPTIAPYKEWQANFTGMTNDEINDFVNLKINDGNKDLDLEFAEPYVDGDIVEISESFIDYIEDGNYIYTIEYLNVEVFFVNSEDDTATGDYNIDYSTGIVNINLNYNDKYEVTYYNKITREEIIVPPSNFGIITSNAHLDMWWNVPGIICLGGNTSDYDNKYMIAVSDDFFSKYNGAIIQFGHGSKSCTLTFEKVDGEIEISFEPDVNHGNWGTINLTQLKEKKKYSDGSWKTNLNGFWFDNPFGSGGAMQASLIRLL